MLKDGDVSCCVSKRSVFEPVQEIIANGYRRAHAWLAYIVTLADASCLGEHHMLLASHWHANRERPSHCTKALSHLLEMAVGLDVIATQRPSNQSPVTT